MSTFFKEHKQWLIPVLLVAAIAPFTSYLDLKIAGYFYTFEDDTGHFLQTPFLHFVYQYGFYPADILGVLALLALILSFIFPTWKAIRPHALLLVLTLGVGAGLIVHGIFKDHWGRPRPRQIIEFSGSKEFYPFYKPNFFDHPEQGKSFPCGHCSTGFYFFVLIPLGRQLKKRWLVYLGVILGTFLGVVLSYARIAQGGHFFSDVLFSALIMWLTALFMEWLIYRKIA